MNFEIYLDAQDWLIKMSPWNLTRHGYQCLLIFSGMSRLLYHDQALAFLPTRAVNRRKRLKNDTDNMETSQVFLYKAIHKKRPAVLISWLVNGTHLYYIFDHSLMKSIDIKRGCYRPALSIDLSFLVFEIFKGPHVSTKACISEMENCILEVNEWLCTILENDELINLVNGVLLRSAIFDRDIGLKEIDSDMMEHDQNWKSFISKVQDESVSADELVNYIASDASQNLTNLFPAKILIIIN